MNVNIFLLFFNKSLLNIMSALQHICRNTIFPARNVIKTRGSPYGLPQNFIAKQNLLYPLTAPAVIPSIKYRWKKRNTTNTGIIPNIDPAINKS